MNAFRVKGFSELVEDSNRVVSPEILNLHPAGVLDAQERYFDHPLRLVQIDHVFDPAFAAKVSDFIQTDARFGSVFGLYKRADPSVDQDTWLKADAAHRFFHYERLSGVGPQTVNGGLTAFMTIRRFLSSDTFCDLVRQITGEPVKRVIEANVQRFAQGHYLRPHHDKADHRKIAFILYLSQDWEARFGGQLTINGRDDMTVTIQPKHNSLVLFDVARHRHHCVDPLTVKAAARTRDTISGWLANSL